jgi:hypothetical protein
MIIKIGDNFNLNGIFDISLLNGIKEVFHNYGSDFANVPLDEFVWMTYKLDEGSISFTRNTYLFYPEIATHVGKYLTDIIDFPFDPGRVHFLKTTGVVKPHRDEGGRQCCINIGIKNSSAAETHYSRKDVIETFFEDHESLICEDGSAYLLDTSKAHAVVGNSNERLLLTYGFGTPFASIVGRLK